METVATKRVVVVAKIENLEDEYMARAGLVPTGQVRTLAVTDAVVDTRVIGLMIPAHLLAPLGLRRTRVRQAKTVGGTVTLAMYEAVRLTVQGRDCVVEVHEVGDHLPVLIGQIPLEALDWVVDPVGQKLIGNPDHGGEHMIDAFGVYG